MIGRRSSGDGSGPGSTSVPESGAAISVFDFDGTLRSGDTLSDFVRWYWRHHRPQDREERARRRRTLTGALVYLSGMGDPGNAKNSALASLPSEAGGKVGNFWAEDHRRWHPEALALLERELLSGRRVLLASASPDMLLAPLLDGSAVPPATSGWRFGGMGIELVASRTSRTTDDYLSLLGKNCRDREKLRRVLEHLKLSEEAGVFGLVASDSAADAPLLALATRRVRVTGQGALTEWPA